MVPALIHTANGDVKMDVDSQGGAVVPPEITIDGVVYIPCCYHSSPSVPYDWEYFPKVVS